MSIRVKFILIMVLAVIVAVLAYPREDQVLKLVGVHKVLHVSQGLDLQGGQYFVFQADLSKTPANQQSQAMTSLVQNLEKRVNPSGTNEATVQQAGSSRVIVECPGQNVCDISQLTKPAILTFFELPAGDSSQLNDTGLGGKDLASATTDIDPNTGQPVINFQLKSSATQKFSDLTTKINQENGRLVIMLDQQIVFDGTVSSPITNGNGQMTGFSNLTTAKQTTDLLNAGALPVPISLAQQQTVGATLGQESIAHSLVAGVIGLGLVALFMLLYYRLAGLVAVAALFIYTCLTLTVYKLSVFTPWTVTLTLAGIAGFILSIGMAVDANILIFERMKEEVRAGKSLVTAAEAGFDRAWPSIRDSNVSTLITCVILYNFGGSVPLIKGFAFTLGLGVVISMLTAVVISRTFLRLVIRSRMGRRLSLYGVKAAEVQA